MAYQIGFDDANDHLYDISIRFRAKQERTSLQLPAWRPGRYLIQNYAANVREWSASGRKSRALPIQKSGKSEWVVESRKGESVEVRYRYYAGTLDAGSSYLVDEEVYFNGSNLFMSVADRRFAPVTLEVRFPAGWPALTQLPTSDGRLFSARDYDHLIDSPFLCSPSLRVHELEQSGCHVRLGFQGAQGARTEQFVKPVRAIVAAQAELFKGIPTEQYTFLYHYGDRWHGVEHESSSSIVVERRQMLDAHPGSESFDHFLAITSHEFFHLWNVKRILPAKFQPYDYSVETPTRLLWVMEGVTSYYGERTLLKSGLWTPQRYLEHLSKEIQTLEAIPGSRFLPVSQASFDAWLQEPSQMHDKSNAWISFYNKGEIVAALLDLSIRLRTGGRRSLDDVMLDLWTRYGQKGRGLEEEAFPRAVARVTRLDFSDFFDRYVDGADPLPYDELFPAAGVSVERRVVAGWTGVKWREDGWRLIVDSVHNESPASKAGLMSGDELIAVGEERVTSEAEFRRLLSAETKRNVALVTVRNRRLRELKMKLPIAYPQQITLLMGGEAQRGLEGWLHAG